MTKRIATGRLTAKQLTDIPEDVKRHIRTLDSLAKVAHRIMQTMLAFELQIRLSIDELESQRLLDGGAGSQTSKELLTLREAARRLGVPMAVLRKDDAQRFPKPVATAKAGAMYRRTEIEAWLSRDR